MPRFKGEEGRGRKRFFFEKKNQKTFIRWSEPLGLGLAPSAAGIPTSKCLRRRDLGWLRETGVAQRREKFFGSFFQKGTFFLSIASTASIAFTPAIFQSPAPCNPPPE
jgi:hypothetical protein